MKRLFAALLASFLAIAPAGAQHGAQPTPPPTAPNEPAQWRGDLDVLSERLNAMHPDPYRRFPRAQFESELAALRQSLPTLSRAEAVAGVMRTIALLGDGHTSIPTDSLRNIGFHALPLRFYAYPEGLYLQAADSAYADAVGGRVISIGGTPVEEAQRRIGALIAFDNSQTIVSRLPNYLIIPELLEATGVIRDADAPVRIQVRKGRRTMTISVAPIAMPHIVQDHQLAVRYSDNWADSRPEFAPLWLANAERPYWMEYLADSRTLFVQYNSAANNPEEPIGRFARRMREEIATREVDRVVLDLRHNVGGDAFWNRSLYLALLRSPKLEEPGRLFIFIGRNTYSAAMMLAIDLQQYARPIFIGEPTGGRIQNYGNHDHVVLPASGLIAMISMDFYQNGLPRDDREWIAPDATVELTAADYAAGRDPALAAAISYRPAVARLREAFEGASPTEMGAAFARFMAQPVNRYLNAEPALTELGYAASRAGEHGRAIAAFEVAARTYPQSANAFDSLGDGYRAAGRTAEAIAAYRRALEISPGYSPSVQSLSQLEGGSAPAPH